MSRPLRSALAALLVAVFAVFAAAGCVSMPSGGPVQPYPITQQQDAQNQPYLQFQPSPPGDGWNPKEIVEGFLTASASLGDNGEVAREYLTAQASKAWKRSWSATVYKNGPNVSNPSYQSGPVPSTSASATGGQSATQPAAADKATVTITGTVQANLSGTGGYAVPSAQNVGSTTTANPTFTLVKESGQWRIAQLPGSLLLTSDSFKNDYQLRNLYFFDPTGQYLVPDPVYVPVQANAALLNGLVHDLIFQPADWLGEGDATSTAFPPGTVPLGDVTLLGGVTAVVNLGGAIAREKPAVLQQLLPQVSGQLFATLSGAGQGGQTVQSIQVDINGQPQVPTGSQNNPVQHPTTFGPALGATGTFYYLDQAGNLVSRNGLQAKGVRLGRLGSAFSQLAVSPDGKYVAALNGSGLLYTALVGDRLSQRAGSDYLSMSWDSNDELWATTSDQIVVVPGASAANEPPMPVSVVNSDQTSGANGPYPALRVAPDGVRVALITGNGQLRFGAISRQQGARPTQLRYEITLSPFSVSTQASFFTSVSWYGPDNVITLAEPGPAVTEYPVNGGTSTSIPANAQMETISASWKQPLLAAQTNNQVAADISLTGSWMSISAGVSPVYPG
jgi:hypothetical protein